MRKIKVFPIQGGGISIPELEALRGVVVVDHWSNTQPVGSGGGEYWYNPDTRLLYVSEATTTEGSTTITWQPISARLQTIYVDATGLAGYIWDGMDMLALGGNAQITIDTTTSTTSTNPLENRVITNALNNIVNTLSGHQSRISALENAVPFEEVFFVDKWGDTAPNVNQDGVYWWDTDDKKLWVSVRSIVEGISTISWDEVEVSDKRLYVNKQDNALYYYGEVTEQSGMIVIITNDMIPLEADNSELSDAIEQLTATANSLSNNIIALETAYQNADTALSNRLTAVENGKVDDVQVNGTSVKNGTNANIPVTSAGDGVVHVGPTDLDVSHQHEWNDIKNAPDMLVGLGVGKGFLEFFHRSGDTSKVEGLFNQVQIQIVPGHGEPSATATCSEGVLTIRFVNIQGEQGVKGDTVILDPDGVSSYTLYDVTGYNVDGAMTQAAVTAALTAKMDMVDDTNADFSIKDENGNSIARFANGEIETKKFNSSYAARQRESIREFAIEDENGNAIVEFENGHIRTKNFDSENIEIEHPVEVENGNYDFSVEDENGNSILRVGQGHIRTKFFDSSNFGVSNKIYCVGDSTTQGQSGIDNPRDDNESSASANCYPNRLQDMLGDQWEVVNLGAGGQNTGEVLSRCGWLDLITPTAFTLYGNGTTSLVCSGAQADKTGVLVDSCAQEPANYFLQQGSTDAMSQMSICYVLGVQCALSVSSANIYIRRTSNVSYNLTIPGGTHITLGGCKGNGIYLLRVGSNDAMRMLSNTNIDNYIAKIKQAVSRMEGGRYLVMGMFHGYEPSTTEQVKWSAMNARLSQEFGARYIDGQAYITSMEAFAAIGVTPTTDADISSARAAQGVKSDEYCMTHSMTPSSFWRASYTPNRQSVDKIHLNYDGYWLMAKMFYDKLVQLNWI